jgi:prevent-host-death family protein
MQVAAGEFKARCLGIMDDVQRTHRAVTITKRGKPVAKLVPVDDIVEPIFGSLRGHVKITGDIVEPTGEQWDADL